LRWPVSKLKMGRKIKIKELSRFTNLFVFFLFKNIYLYHEGNKTIVLLPSMAVEKN